MSYKPDEYIQKSLTTWYPIDHELHFDPLHPVIKLAGEAGELLDLYGKHKFKPGFDWWNCKYCEENMEAHIVAQCCKVGKGYTSKVLDELGDWWYYWRILAYQKEQSISEWINIPYKDEIPDDMFMFLSEMNYQCAEILRSYEQIERINLARLRIAFNWLQDILILLNITFDELTETNYLKLNSEETNHGWKDAGVKNEP